MEKQLRDNIIVNPGIMAGKPVIKGTRIPVDLIAGLLAEGLDINEILEDYPVLKREDILAVLEYMASLARGDSAYSIKIENE